MRQRILTIMGTTYQLINFLSLQIIRRILWIFLATVVSSCKKLISFKRTSKIFTFIRFLKWGMPNGFNKNRIDLNQCNKIFSYRLWAFDSEGDFRFRFGILQVKQRYYQLLGDRDIGRFISEIWASPPSFSNKYSSRKVHSADAMSGVLG